MRSILRFLNPISHLGEKRYPLLFPLLTMISVCVISELYCYFIVHNPMAVAWYAIYLFAGLIIYFAFRVGIAGGIIASLITVAYYFYIIYTRNYQGQQLKAGIETTIILGLLYVFVAGIIGWLKQKIDSLIESEADERKRLQAIVQQLPVGIVITDEKGKILQSNKQMSTILGRSIDQGAVIGQFTLENSTYKDRPVSPSQWPLARTLATGKSIVGKEFTIKNDQGKTVHIQISSSLIRGRGRKVIAAAAITNDITQQKELDARKNEFVNMASHELKTPLTSMRLYLDSLKIKTKKISDEKFVKIIRGLDYQTEKLQELVEDLLDVSRIQTGKLFFNKEEFVLNKLVKETLEGLRGAAKNHKITFSEKQTIKVYADRFRIYQVLTNLLTNAIKYSPEGKRIIVTLKKSNGQAQVSVQDFGFGIEKDQQIKIFERLYQVNNSLEKTFPGLGIGLYISKEIIRRHKGKIWVESKKNKGSTFFFNIPLKR